MFRFAFFAMVLVLVIALPGAADAQSKPEAAQAQNCQQDSPGRSIGRGILGGLGRRVIGRIGAPSLIAVPTYQVLDETVTSLLDCREQQQAVEATNEAIRQGVGGTSTWTSESRPGVTGTSTVTAAEGECMTVTDVIIVDGEETTVPKRMCRQPPSNRYVRV
ncbi:MAG: hypothetical protein ACT4OE_00960 [Sphingosinicella sp.]